MRWHDSRFLHRGESGRQVGSSAAKRLSLAAVLLCALLVVHVGTATAYFSGTGSGSGSTQAASIVGPSGVTATQSGTTVSVSWSAAMLTSGVAVQGYKVTRSDGTVICGSPTLVAALSCTDAAVPAGTYTYSVDAIYNTWDASATSASITILTAPTISSKPPSASNSASASFGFSGGNGSSYQCKLDGGSYGACTSPQSYGSLGQGSHTFTVRAVNGSSTGPSTSYTWTVDTVPPTQSLALGSGATGAYLSGTTLYYRGVVAGALQLVDTVSDSGTGPASAAYPSIATTGWTHANETVTTPSGGPYTSSTFSWTASPSNPSGYSVTAADGAANTTSTALTFVNDSTAPAGGALTVNATAAITAGSISQATNSTSFTIGSRTDYTDGGSGLKSSVLTVQSESLSGSACGAAGGPFATATTISGTTQPSGIVAGYCYVYTLTGTDNVGNVASISTTVVDNALSFKVTAQPSTALAGTAASIVLTAIRNGTTDTSYTGAPLTWNGASNSPTGTAPTLPTSPTWTAGVATFTITLADSQTATLSVTDGTRSVTFTPIVVSAGAASNVAWTNPSSSVTPLPSPCAFTCTYSSGFGSTSTWSAYVSITDAQGNVVAGTGQTVTITLGGSAKGTVTPATITLPSSGAATSTTQVQYTSVAHGNYTDTLSAGTSTLTSAGASFTK